MQRAEGDAAAGRRGDGEVLAGGWRQWGAVCLGKGRVDAEWRK